MSPNNPRMKLIKAGRLIDSVDGRVIENAAVLIEGSNIRQVGPSAQVVAPEGAQVEEYDYSDKTVLPGLVDAHTHMNFPGDGTMGDEVGAEDDDILLLRSAYNANVTLKSGVTTARENGAKNRTVLSMKEGIRRNLVAGPRMIVCGRPITITGGHMWYFGCEADGVDAVRNAVRQLVTEGADYIKIVATGGSTESSYPNLASYSVEELKAIVDEAHKFGKLTAGHCRSEQGIINALEVGIDMILHATAYIPDGTYTFRPDLAERIAKAGAWVNPTIHVQRAWAWFLEKKKQEEGLTPDDERRLKRFVAETKNRMDNCRDLKKAGVKLVAGSDNWGIYPVGQFYNEVEAMTESGFSNAEAILSATRDSAISLGVGGEVGTLESGKQADVLVVDGNPVENITALSRVAAVFKGGELVE